MAAKPPSTPSSSPQASILPYKLPGLDGSLTLLHSVGSGSYGKVYLGQTSDGSLRAAKCIPLKTLSEASADSDVSPESEPTFLKLVKHSNVIRLYDSKVIGGRLWVRDRGRNASTFGDLPGTCWRDNPLLTLCVCAPSCFF